VSSVCTAAWDTGMVDPQNSLPVTREQCGMTRQAVNLASCCFESDKDQFSFEDCDPIAFMR